jgi:hypothetical protein
MPPRSAQSALSYAWRNQVVRCIDCNIDECQNSCAELFALCHNYSWRQSATPAVFAAPRDQVQ